MFRGYEVDPVSAEKYTWLTELALHKNRYPGLAHVTISEDTEIFYEVGRQEPWTPHQWDLPLQLRAAYDTAGIRLEVFLRKPVDETEG